MPQATRAVIRDGVFYANGCGLAAAPAGEYEIVRLSVCEILFSDGAHARAFTLSVDAVAQHLCEGRLRLLDGDKLPALPAKR
ncbi:hypothetical protein [Amphiplicatus metriothermophilus]|uniref:Uncharacterized protein n=1 Tax=Amphiplicatus metriothermophilus TaxID=1519374 RepID=A0A239PJ09_9PROT|nr:hypothetical protein [Amphiplicatus metriothermophilus]MBB5518061.1 hypothetical protein [Amphiplicatus metriothermophilus]SNT67605.1 hypothetical protein SAMN06297382_0095 [Amphiplicatus metriothermophilus]